MSTVLRALAVLLLGGGVLAEAMGALPAVGVALVLGICLASYFWFLAMARQALRPPQRRRS